MKNFVLYPISSLSIVFLGVNDIGMEIMLLFNLIGDLLVDLDQLCFFA